MQYCLMTLNIHGDIKLATLGVIEFGSFLCLVHAYKYTFDCCRIQFTTLLTVIDKGNTTKDMAWKTFYKRNKRESWTVFG